MPKETANCTCKYCGKSFIKELIETGKGASKRLAEKIQWAEDGGIDECTDCWKARKREEEKAAGLTCEIRLGNAVTNPDTVYAIFGGDTYPHKDELKAAGCRWTDRYPESGALAELLSIKAPRPMWVMEGKDVDELAKLAGKLGAVKVTLPSEEQIMIWAGFVRAGQKRKAQQAAEEAKKAEEASEQMAAELEALGEIPAWPESVRAKWPQGAKWNCKVYGRQGNRCIYLANQKIGLTDEEAEAMENAYAARSEWRQRKEEIEQRYKRGA